MQQDLSSISNKIERKVLAFMTELCKLVKGILIEALVQANSNVMPEYSIDTETLISYTRYTPPKIIGNQITCDIYIDTYELQRQEEKDAVFHESKLLEWSRYKFTFDGVNGKSGDNQIDGKPIAWHMVNWLEKGNTMPFAVGNQPIRAAHVFYHAYRWTTTRWNELIDKALIRANAKDIKYFIHIFPPILIEAI